jgi:hypothetical protein
MIALISISKYDYDAIEIFCSKQDFFVKALGILDCPSSPTGFFEYKILIALLFF